MHKPKPILFLLLLFYTLSVYSQTKTPADEWERIDSLVKLNKDFEKVLDQLKNIRQKASRENLSFEVARTYQYELLIADARTEDSLWFKNSAFLDTILSQAHLPEELHWSVLLIKAKRIKEFANRYLRFRRSSYLRNDVLVNYAAYTNSQLDSIATASFDEARALATGLHHIEGIKALWLSESPLMFLIKPDLFDITILEQIRLFSKPYYPNTEGANNEIREWMSLSQDAFIKRISTKSEIFGNLNPVIDLYIHWILSSSINLEKKYFVETLIRKFLFEKYKYPESKGLANVYEKYLGSIIISNFSSVKAFGVYELCNLYKTYSEKYFPYSSYTYGSLYSNIQFDTTYRSYAGKAVQLYESHQLMLDSFYSLKYQLFNLVNQIKATDISLVIENDIVPGKPVLAQVRFRNLDTLHWQIISLSNADYLSLQYKRSGQSYDMVRGNNKNESDRKWLNEILKRQPFLKQKTAIPETKDYNYHLTYETLELPATGKYILLFSSRTEMDTTDYTGYVFLSASNIATVNNDNRIYVLDRLTGKPLVGAMVDAISKTQPTDSKRASIVSIKKYIVNKQGYVITPGNTYTDIEVRYNGDTISKSINYNERNLPYDIYDKDEYDDLLEYYADNAFVQVFTDRSIYRPGQTVHYKVLFLTRNPRTGSYIVINKDNLKGKLFGNLYKKWIHEEDPWIYIYDPFGKEMDSLKARPNEYGSISGSFHIPKTAATGEWTIESDVLDTKWSEGTFSVEEYKRPSYEISIQNPRQELLPGDPFAFVVKIKSFAGASLNNIKVAYLLSRQGTFPTEDNNRKPLELIDTVGYTNEDGELKILVNDSLIARYALDSSKKYDFPYSLQVEALDETGESYEGNATITISSQPIAIAMSSQTVYNLSNDALLQITTSHKNAGTVFRQTAIKVYRLAEEDLSTGTLLQNADTWLYDSSYFKKWFPYLSFSTDRLSDNKKLVLDTFINTGKTSVFRLDTSFVSAGLYEIEASIKENDVLRGLNTKRVQLFDAIKKQLPSSTFNFSYLPYNMGDPGSKIVYYYGNSEQEIYSVFHISYYTKDRKMESQSFYTQGLSSRGLNEFVYTIPKAAIGSLKFVHIYIWNNKLYKNEKTVYINDLVDNPEVIIEKYRTKLVPGGKETFSISIKTKNTNTAAEVMSTLYDASLDKLAEHDWKSFLSRATTSYNAYVFWPSSLNYTERGSVFIPFAAEKYPDQKKQTPPLWWLKPDSVRLNNNDWEHLEGMLKKMPEMLSTALAGRIPGLDFSKNLESVVVVGYGIRRESASMPTSIIVRGAASSLSSYKQPLIILDGLPFDGDINSINASLITAGLVLKGADATALYGARAAEGVLILSTKGEIVLPQEIKEELKPRKNFSETAFFFPTLHAKKNGYYSFTFIMPESVTEWNWKILAHTKNAQYAYAEKKLITQLPLMVQPNMPRFLYQGDQITLQSRITNLDTNDIKGTITCTIEDAITGENLTNKVTEHNQLAFSINKKTNISSVFRLTIPKTQINPIKILVAAKSQSFSDAEEHVIPILSPKIFVRSSLPLILNGQADTTLHIPALPVGSEIYGLGISIHPKPQSVLINSLPYLANYAYDCAEQTFNKLLAYVTAWSIMRTDSAAKASFEKAKADILKANDRPGSLPDEMAEESMPWLQMANKTRAQQQQLFNLLDTSKSLPAIRQFLNRLYKLQQQDGGLSWFDGGKSDFYISCYVLNGLAQIYNNNEILLAGIFDSRLWNFVSDLLKYCDSRFIQVHEGNRYYGYQYLNTRGNWLVKYPIKDSMLTSLIELLEVQWKSADTYSLHNQAVLILSTFHYLPKGNALYNKAVSQLQSIRQMAIEDDVNGIRWKSLADAEDLAVTAEETVAMLTEAFNKAGMDITDGVLKWLMGAKKEHHWKTTKATAAVVRLLEKQKRTVLDVSQTFTLNLADTSINVTDDMLSGNNLNFVHRKSLPSSVRIAKQGQGDAAGTLQWYYFTSSTIGNNNNGLKLSKQVYGFNKDGIKRIITEKDTLHLGDVVEVVLILESNKALSYVHVNDRTVAAFEPVDNSSGYEYNQFGYYKSIRDGGPQFFASFIPSGKHEIRYKVKVAHEGSFITGQSVLQCMYTPELITYGNSIKINTGK